jgi:hypothetical protein
MYWLFAIMVAAISTAAIAVRSGSVHAQASERVMVDMVVESLPGRWEGHCTPVEPGTLNATVQAVGDRGLFPVRFNMGIALNVEAENVNTMVATAPVTYPIRVERGLYCYSFYNEYPAPQNIVLGELRQYAQFVSLRLAWTP